ncbi:MAG: hypothetical protein K0Q49_1493 [Haloplasmataceae bacterium]|jgi:hypothetical protein|nr:hypothetical protein [Haloplasmataceae bacterium]
MKKKLVTFFIILAFILFQQCFLTKINVNANVESDNPIDMRNRDTYSISEVGYFTECFYDGYFDECSGSWKDTHYFYIDDSSTTDDYYYLNLDINQNIFKIDIYRYDGSGYFLINANTDFLTSYTFNLLPGRYYIEITTIEYYTFQYTLNMTFEKYIKNFEYVETPQNVCAAGNICIDPYIQEHIRKRDGRQTQVYYNIINEFEEVEVAGGLDTVHITEASVTMVTTDYFYCSSFCEADGFEFPVNEIKYLRYKITYKDLFIDNYLNDGEANTLTSAVKIEIITNALYEYKSYSNTLTLMDYNSNDLLSMNVNHHATITNLEETNHDLIKTGYQDPIQHEVREKPDMIAAHANFIWNNLDSEAVTAINYVKSVGELANEYWKLYLYNEIPFIDGVDFNENEYIFRNHVNTDTYTLVYKNLSLDAQTNPGDSLELTIKVEPNNQNYYNILFYTTPLFITDPISGKTINLDHSIKQEYYNFDRTPESIEITVPTNSLSLTLFNARSYDYTQGVSNDIAAPIQYIIKKLDGTIVNKENLSVGNYKVYYSASKYGRTGEKIIDLSVMKEPIKMQPLNIPKGMNPSDEFLLNGIMSYDYYGNRLTENTYMYDRSNLNFQVTGTYTIKVQVCEPNIGCFPYDRTVKVVNDGYIGTIDNGGVLQSININGAGVGQYTFTLTSDKYIDAVYITNGYSIRLQRYNDTYGVLETLHYGGSFKDFYCTPGYYELTVIWNGASSSSTDLKLTIDEELSTDTHEIFGLDDNVNYITSYDYENGSYSGNVDTSELYNLYEIYDESFNLLGIMGSTIPFDSNPFPNHSMTYDGFAYQDNHNGALYVPLTTGYRIY